MPQGLIAHICFLGLVLSAIVAAQAQQPKPDSNVATSKLCRPRNGPG